MIFIEERELIVAQILKLKIFYWNKIQKIPILFAKENVLPPQKWLNSEVVHSQYLNTLLGLSA